MLGSITKTSTFILLFFVTHLYAVTQDTTDGAYSPEMVVEIDDSEQKSLKNRKKLTGDWGGLRSSLKEDGIIIKSSLTSFYQGAKTNGNSGYDYEFGSQLGLTVILNGKKLGLWDGFFIGIRGQLNMGNSVNGDGGVLLPVNTALAYPGIDGSDRSDASLYIVQFLSPKDKIILGKLSTIDLTNYSKYKGGSGLTGFQNVSFVSGPNGITTPSVLGAFYISERDKFNYTLAFYDSESSLNRMGLSDRFAKGTTFFASVDIKTHFFGQSGKQGIMGAKSTQDSFVYQEYSKEGKRYFVGYYFDQTIQTFSNKASWGLFGQAVMTDNDATPTDYSFIFGMGGNSFIQNRSQDRWGLAYFKYSLSNYIQNATDKVSVNSEYGYEVFYDYQATPWLSFGIDLQLVKPALRHGDATFIGLRSKIDF